jgi:hypothetical protein
MNETLDHTPRWRRATFAGTLQRSAGRIALEVQHYYVVAEPVDTGFRITFPASPTSSPLQWLRGTSCRKRSARWP